jgi:hypothetical protein
MIIASKIEITDPIKTLIMFAFIFLIISAVILYSHNSQPDSSGYSPDFIDHVKSNSRSVSSDCVVTKMRQRWHTQADLYKEANEARVLRGETDAVNFVIRKVQNECPK